MQQKKLKPRFVPTEFMLRQVELAMRTFFSAPRVSYGSSLGLEYRPPKKWQQFKEKV